ncbi:MAG: hypothetical protein JHC95_17035 [Solirubrobacteraceae bacterium]|nr:hypothetical protein [Solirubrobacteraceae bacterium]
MFVLAGIIDTTWGVIGVVGGIASIVVMLRVSASSTRERDEEDHNRAFYDEHGHWPDQQPGAPPDPLPPVH